MLLLFGSRARLRVANPRPWTSGGSIQAGLRGGASAGLAVARGRAGARGLGWGRLRITWRDAGLGSLPP